MKITLIHPYITSHSKNTCLTEPLGLVALASYAKQELGDNIDIGVLDLFTADVAVKRLDNGLFLIGLQDPAEISRRLKQLNPDVIGITCNFTAYFDDALAIAQVVRQACPKAKLILGGAHITMEAEKILRLHDVDFAVMGEGELTFVELLRALQNNETDFSTIAGLCYKQDDGEVTRNMPRELIRDISVLPIPDRSFIDLEQYKKLNTQALAYVREAPVATLMTSRGCPYNCIFCSTKIMWERKWRPLPPQMVVDEIEFLHKKYGFREFAINDDQFIIDRKRVHKICDLLLERGIKVSFSIPPGTSIWLVEEDLMRKMKQVGFYRLCFPVESGNQRTIDFIRKPIKLDVVAEKIRLANRLGFWTQGNFIIGFPYETREEILTTIDFAYKCGLDYAIFYIAKPLAGAEMYDIYVKEGLLKKINQGSNVEFSDCDTLTLTADELNQLQAQAISGFFKYKLRFYLTPANFRDFVWPKFKSWADFVYAMRIFYVLMNQTIIPLIMNALRSKRAG